MSVRSLPPWLRAAALGGLLAALPAPPPAAAQTSAISWNKPATVTRREKPGPKPRARRQRPRPRVEKVPLLTLQWRVLKVEADGTRHETNPNAVFYTNDRIQFAVKANQDGYLYILNQNEGKNGEIVTPPTLIFPNSQVNGGRNFVKKDQEFVVPSDYPATITPPAGRVVLFVVFSRDLITDLPESIAEGGPRVIPQNFVNGLKGTQQSLVRTSRPDVSPEKGGGAGQYVVWVQNADPKNNEALVETIVLTNEDRPSD